MKRANLDTGTITPQSEDFGEIRRLVSHRLFLDPSYNTFDAMAEMTIATEDYIQNLAQRFPPNVLWVGGSLGRGEMLPNSDIDLFVVYDAASETNNEIRVEGVDKFEIGHIDRLKLHNLLQYSFIDANRFIDGRSIGLAPAGHVESMIFDVNTPDRQLANNISEYFYYRYFDFPQKTTTMGPNLKYSTGSSRDTIFFNMISRMTSGKFPATRGNHPELPEATDYVSGRYGITAPNSAIDLLFLTKNAAISVFDATRDPSTRYVSHRTLDAIYAFCKSKFVTLGYKDSYEYIDAYKAARNELELSVDTLFTMALNEHPAKQELARFLNLSGSDLAKEFVAEVKDQQVKYPQSTIAFGGWLAMRESLPAQYMEQMAESLMQQPIDRTWGGLMAVVCSPSTADNTLSKLADWLYVHEKGAYLTKLITRNPSSSSQTKEKALSNYKEKEIII